MKIPFSIKKISLITLFLLFLNSTIKAADAGTQLPFWSNGPLMLMLFSIIILLVVIIIIGRIVSALVVNDTNEIWKKRREGKITGMLLILVFSSLSAFSQDAAVAEPASKAVSNLMFGMDATLFWVMLSVIIFEFIVLIALTYVLYVFLLKKGLVKPLASRLPKWMQFNAMMGSELPVERESEILTDHDYDGIQELDNGMPPMLKYIFVITVIAAFAYWINYHVIEASPLMIEEYEMELEKAAIAKEEYLKKAGNAVDENTVVLSKEESVIASGEKIYMQNCLACHGDKGQGGVGPNFTDNYWIHGGDIKSVFSTIKYGVPAKGMRSWQSEIKPGDMQAVSSYILTELGGTNVAGGKAPQGDLFVAKSDSAIVSKDSMPVVNDIDTTKK